MLGVSWMGEVAAALQETPLGATLVVAGVVLLWWRAVKLVALHGVPFKMGMTIADGRMDQGLGGRPVTFVHIGDIDVHREEYAGRFLYGAIFRAHPSSDKVVRARLELMVLAMPFGSALTVQESRLMFQKAGHESRAKQYRLVFDKYLRKRESMPQDTFRREVVRQMRSVGQYFDKRRTVRRIDGFDWHFFIGGGGFVSNDFGYRISFELLDGGKYKVKELGPTADEEAIVDSIAEVRALAMKELDATPPTDLRDSVTLTRLVQPEHINDVRRRAERMPESVAMGGIRESGVVLAVRVTDVEGNGLLVWRYGEELPTLRVFS